MSGETLHYTTSTWNHLNAYAAHDILRLRSEIFVVEQDCVYQDIDGLDLDALHCMIHQDGILVAYARILEREARLAIGRVVVRQSHRASGIGRALMLYTLDQCRVTYDHREIELSAQCYIQSFYESLGFVAEGESYLEDGIPHIHMTLTDVSSLSAK